MTTEKVALVWIHYCNGLGMFRSACEVLDTPEPETKVFRFKEGCEWGMWDGSKKPTDVRKLVLYSSWSEFAVGQREGQYRITRALELLPGSVAVLEGTTRPEAV